MFRRPIGFGVAEVHGDALDVLENQVAQLAVGGKASGPDQPAVGLLAAVEPQAAHLAVPGVVAEDRPVGRAVPEEHRRCRVLTDEVGAQVIVVFLAQRGEGAVDTIGAGRKVEHAPAVLHHGLHVVQGPLDGGRVVSHAVALGAVVGLDVFPTGEGPGELLARLVICDRLAQAAPRHAGPRIATIPRRTTARIAPACMSFLREVGKA